MEAQSDIAPRIMMIDDEVSNLQIVKILLMRESYQSDLVLFETGREALEYLRHEPVDLILLDLAMPEMDGFEVMARLREQPGTADIPVIFLSAFQETEYILKAFELGATDFIGKPIISPILNARIRQIIETRRLEQELRLSNEVLTNTNRLKDELLSVCSHDLRAPLNAIELICQFLRDTLTNPSPQRPQELVNRIVSQSRMARRLVENLLDLNRIEEGHLLPSPSFFGVAELAQTCLEDERPTLQARELEGKLVLPETDLICFGDREMLSQVVHNVLNNASRFARKRIELRVAAIDADALGGGHLEISIADDGRGIPTDQQAGVFDKYEKAEGHVGGSGLGLYIARQMVELHDGTIRVQSREGRGARFVIELPNAYRPEQLPDLSPLYQRRVWVLSGSRTVGQLLEGVLVETGMIEVSRLSTVDDVGRAVRTARPELVVAGAHEADLVHALLEAAQQAEQPVAAQWIVFGPPGPSARLAEPLPEGTVCLQPPFNPLVYLHQVQALLDGEGTTGGVSNV